MYLNAIEIQILLLVCLQIASGYDIASFLCLVPVSYFGGRLGASKPKWIGWGVVIMGIGSFVFALPHFLVGPYRTEITDNSNVCSAGVNSTSLEVNHIFVYFELIKKPLMQT